MRALRARPSPDADLLALSLVAACYRLDDDLRRHQVGAHLIAECDLRKDSGCAARGRSGSLTATPAVVPGQVLSSGSFPRVLRGQKVSFQYSC